MTRSNRQTIPRIWRGLAGAGGGLLLLALLVLLLLPPGGSVAGAGRLRAAWTGGSPASANGQVAPQPTLPIDERETLDIPPAPTAPPAEQGAPPALTPSAQANLLPWAFPLTSEFGQYPNGGAHFGLDIGATYGVVQTAPVGGVVEDVLRGCIEGDQRCGLGWGNHVWWKSSETGHHILLAHFSRLEDWVQSGATVQVGAALGVTGSTGFSSGPHVHFQVNTAVCCDNASAINPALEFPALACGAPVVGARFGAPCP